MQWAGAILLPVACPALQYFFILSHKRHDFGNEVIEHKMCISIFCKIFSEAFLILRRIDRDMIVNVY